MLGMGGVEAQQYSFTFRLDGATDSVLYIGQHFRDKTTVVDTARLHRGSYTFAGRRKWERGVYALLRQDGKTAVGDFCIDGSRRFTIEGDARLSAASVKVKGCETNSAMYAYMAVEDAAKIAGFSKFHFSRLFKQFTEQTFCGYLNQRRIMRLGQVLMA